MSVQSISTRRISASMASAFASTSLRALACLFQKTWSGWLEAPDPLDWVALPIGKARLRLRTRWAMYSISPTFFWKSLVARWIRSFFGRVMSAAMAHSIGGRCCHGMSRDPVGRIGQMLIFRAWARCATILTPTPEENRDDHHAHLLRKVARW